MSELTRRKYSILFKDVTGRPLVKRVARYGTSDEVDESLFEAVSRLFYEDRDAFYALKRQTREAARSHCDAVVLSVAGYFDYVDCEFKKALMFFKKAIAAHPADIEPWFCCAFCFRQMGEEKMFNTLMLHYNEIIEDYQKGAARMESVIHKHARDLP